jgi:hypothetical protein
LKAEPGWVQGQCSGLAIQHRGLVGLPARPSLSSPARGPSSRAQSLSKHASLSGSGIMMPCCSWPSLVHMAGHGGPLPTQCQRGWQPRRAPARGGPGAAMGLAAASELWSTTLAAYDDDADAHRVRLASRCQTPPARAPAERRATGPPGGGLSRGRGPGAGPPAFSASSMKGPLSGHPGGAEALEQPGASHGPRLASVAVRPGACAPSAWQRAARVSAMRL